MSEELPEYNAVGKPHLKGPRAVAEPVAVPLPMPRVRPKPQAEPVESDTLYEVRKKVYARAVSGLFANWRWGMVWLTQILYYGLCWLDWNGRQAVLFHLVERKFYIFGWVFWPQDVFYLAVLLIISALSLFLFTTVAGRLWCGYACPQTVYTEIFMWIEQRIEGDRSRSMKLDAAPTGLRKVRIKATKYAAWIAVAGWTGITFVGYFTPIRELLPAIGDWSVGPWEAFWILFYGSFTYIFAGVMREQVCKYMCPYARFQGVMFDSDTLTITYDAGRGESRGSRRKGSDVKAQGLGDCVDCGICVQVCPTGIDIRDGLQYECIGCAACIDACDQVMDKMDYPRGLIRYSTENALRQHWGWRAILAHVLRPRVVIYSGVLLAICVALLVGLATRSELRVDVIKDRRTLSREVEGGLIENVYTLQVMNMAEEAREFQVRAEGLEGIAIDGLKSIEMAPTANRSLTIRVRVPVDDVAPGVHPVWFSISSRNNPDVHVREKAVFIVP